MGLGGAARRDDRQPGIEAVARQTRFGQGWHIGQYGCTGTRGHANGAQFAALDVRRGCGHRQKIHVNLATHEVGRERTGAAVRYVCDESASLLFEQLVGQVQHRAVAGRAVVQLARACLDQGCQLARIFSGNAGVDHQHQGHGAKDADGRDVLGVWVTETRVLTHNGRSG